MTFANLVKVTIIIPDRKHTKENRRIRIGVLGLLQPAITLLIAGIYDEHWLIEIESIAAE